MKIVLGASIGVLALLTYYFFEVYTAKEMVTKELITKEVMEKKSFQQPETNGVRMITYKNQAFGFSFLYRSTPYGYQVFENTKDENIASNMLHGVSLIRATDYTSVIESKYTDGPPMISVSIYQSGGVTDITTWLYNNMQITNCEEGTVLSTVVANRDAASCLWDGLYSGITVGVLRDDKVYLLTGTRDETEEEGYSYMKDFDGVVQSFIVGE